MRPNAIRRLIPLISRSEVISFAGGVPAPATFPSDEIAEIAARLIRNEGERVLQYATTRGDVRFVEAVAERVRSRGVAWADRDSVILTSGSQQALDLVARVLVDPGDIVFVELPSYIGGLASLWAAGAELRGAPISTDGIDARELDGRVAAAKAEGRTVRAIYTIPSFQNPAGITATMAAREALLELAERHDLVIIEDDPYSEVYFGEDGRPPAPIAALPRARERVVYLGSFSKVLCPGLRCAWAAADRDLRARMELAKESADLCSSPLDHGIVFEALRQGLIDERLPWIREFYRARCSAMLAALAREAPAGFRWTRPTGGLFVWLDLPEGVDANARLGDAVNAGVAYVPGAPFFVEEERANSLRLAFSKEDPEKIEAGIRTLVQVLGQ